jgi:hypothetical protein
LSLPFILHSSRRQTDSLLFYICILAIRRKWQFARNPSRCPSFPKAFGRRSTRTDSLLFYICILAIRRKWQFARNPSRYPFTLRCSQWSINYLSFKFFVCEVQIEE